MHCEGSRPSERPEKMHCEGSRPSERPKKMHCEGSRPSERLKKMHCEGSRPSERPRKMHCAAWKRCKGKSQAPLPARLPPIHRSANRDGLLGCRQGRRGSSGAMDPEDVMVPASG